MSVEAVYLDEKERSLINSIRELDAKRCSHLEHVDFVAACMVGLNMVLGIAHDDAGPRLLDVLGQWLTIALNDPGMNMLSTLAAIYDLPEADKP